MGRSSLSVATPSPPLLSVRLLGTSRRSCAMSPLTSSRRCPPLLPPPPWRSLMSFPMARSSPLATSASGAPRPSSSPLSWAWRLVASTRPPTTPSWSAMLISGRTCMPTLSCPVAPPCTPVSPTGCRRRSLPSPQAPSRSRSLLPPRGSTPSGSVAPSSPPFPPSSRCGSPSRSTTSADPPLSTASASKLIRHVYMHLFILLYDQMISMNDHNLYILVSLHDYFSKLVINPKYDLYCFMIALFLFFMLYLIWNK